MNALQRLSARVGRAILKRSAVGETWVQDDRGAEVPRFFSAGHAAKLPAIGAAVRGIAKRDARLPLNVYDVKRDGTRELADPADPVVRLVTTRWSEHQTRVDGVMQMLSSVLLHGKGGVLVERENDVPVRLLPLDPLGLSRTRYGKTIIYRISLDGIGQTDVERDDLLYLPFFPPRDGVTDRSPLQEHWPAIRAALSAELFSGNYYAKGAIPSIIYKLAQRVADLRTSNKLMWEIEDEMRRRGHRSMIAAEGYDPVIAGGNVAEADVVGVKTFGVQDAARIYDVPPMLILQDHSRSTYSNIQEAREELAETIDGWCGRLSAEISNIIWPPGESSMPRVCQFDTSGLALERFSVRMRGYRDGRESGVLTANECRDKEGLDASDQEGANDLMLEPVPGINITPRE